MYEDCIIKKSVLSIGDCNSLVDFFLKKIETHNPIKGHTIEGKNQLTFLAVDYADKRTEWFPYIEETRRKVSLAFGLNAYKESLTSISILLPPGQLSMHIDLPIKERIRIILLLQRPENGAEVVLSQKMFSEKTTIPLEIGDCYQLPAHKYFHGLTKFQEGLPRIAIIFDWKI